MQRSNVALSRTRLCGRWAGRTRIGPAPAEIREREEADLQDRRVTAAFVIDRALATETET